jgi:hypothetical protein
VFNIGVHYWLLTVTYEKWFSDEESGFAVLVRRVRFTLSFKAVKKGTRQAKCWRAGTPPTLQAKIFTTILFWIYYKSNLKAHNRIHAYRKRDSALTKSINLYNGFH